MRIIKAVNEFTLKIGSFQYKFIDVQVFYSACDPTTVHIDTGSVLKDFFGSFGTIPPKSQISFIFTVPQGCIISNPEVLAAMVSPDKYPLLSANEIQSLEEALTIYDRSIQLFERKMISPKFSDKHMKTHDEYLKSNPLGKAFSHTPHSEEDIYHILKSTRGLIKCSLDTGRKCYDIILFANQTRNKIFLRLFGEIYYPERLKDPVLHLIFKYCTRSAKNMWHISFDEKRH
jgi:hypothetical protein